MRLYLVVAAMGALSGSCHYGVSDISVVPANPTYNKDVYPLFRDHCLVCHSSPPARGAPGNFRLDAYDDINGVSGANKYAGSAVGQVTIDKMPPEAKNGDGVGPNGKAMLQNWLANGAPQ